MSDSKSMGKRFRAKLSDYDVGTLFPSTVKWEKQSQYPALEDKLVSYIHNREQMYAQDNCGLSWEYISQKSVEWSRLEGDSCANFRASSGFINRCFKRHTIVSIRLHGEGGSLPYAEVADAMADFRCSLP